MYIGDVCRDWPTPLPVDIDEGVTNSEHEEDTTSTVNGNWSSGYVGRVTRVEAYSEQDSNDLRETVRATLDSMSSSQSEDDSDSNGMLEEQSGDSHGMSPLVGISLSDDEKLLNATTILSDASQSSSNEMSEDDQLKKEHEMEVEGVKEQNNLLRSLLHEAREKSAQSQQPTYVFTTCDDDASGSLSDTQYPFSEVEEVNSVNETSAMPAVIKDAKLTELLKAAKEENRSRLSLPATWQQVHQAIQPSPVTTNPQAPPSHTDDEANETSHILSVLDTAIESSRITDQDSLSASPELAPQHPLSFEPQAELSVLSTEQGDYLKSVFVNAQDSVLEESSDKTEGSEEDKKEGVVCVKENEWRMSDLSDSVVISEDEESGGSPEVEERESSLVEEESGKVESEVECEVEPEVEPKVESEEKEPEVEPEVEAKVEESEEVEKEGSHTPLEESSQSEEEEEESEGSHSAQESEETEREGSHTSSEESVESENEGPHSPEESEEGCDVIELGDSSSSDNDARPQPDPEPIPEPEPTAFSQIPPVFYNDDAFKPRYTMEEINKSLRVLHELPTKRVTFTRGESEVASEQAIEAKLKQGELWLGLLSVVRVDLGLAEKVVETPLARSSVDSQRISFTKSKPLRRVGTVHHASPLSSLLSQLEEVNVCLRVNRKRNCVPGIVVKAKKEAKKEEKVGEMACEDEEGVLSVPLRKRIVEEKKMEGNENKVEGNENKVEGSEKQVAEKEGKKEVKLEGNKTPVKPLSPKPKKSDTLICPVLSQPQRAEAVSLKLPSTRLVIESPQEPMTIKNETLWERRIAKEEKNVSGVKRNLRRRFLIKLSADFEKEEKEMEAKKEVKGVAKKKEASGVGFGFGGKVEKEKEEKPAFAFGASKEEKKEKKEEKKPAFSFGGKPKEEEKKEEKPAGPMFSFGASKEEEKEAKKPAFAFGAKPQNEEKKEEVKPSPFAFGAKPQNEEKKEEKSAFSFGAKPTEEKEKASASATSFGASKEETKPAFSFGAKPKEEKEEKKPAFAFGAQPKEEKETPSGPMFSFGAKPKEEEKKPAFAFGASDDTAKTPAISAAVGEKKEGDSKPAGPMFSFGGKENGGKSNPFVVSDKEDEKKPAFAFGGKSSDNEAKPAPSPFAFGGKKEENPAGPMFSFGASKEEKKEEVKSPFAFGAKPTEDAKPNPFSFGAKPQNEEKKEETKPAFSFGAPASAKPAEENKPAFSFGAKPTETKPVFGASKEEKKEETKSTPFSFGAKPTEETKPTFSFGAKPADNKPAFSFGAPAGDKPKEENKPAFAFGASKETKPSPFAFGGNSSTQPQPSPFGAPPSQPVGGVNEKPGFAFGGNSNAFGVGGRVEGANAGFSFGPKTTEKAPNPFGFGNSEKRGTMSSFPSNPSGPNVFSSPPQNNNSVFSNFGQNNSFSSMPAGGNQRINPPNGSFNGFGGNNDGFSGSQPQMTPPQNVRFSAGKDSGKGSECGDVV